MGEAKTHYEVIVVGAGVAGIYQIKRLLDLGIDATVLDSAADLGGTWYWNRYPGCRFDSESYTYGFSFSRELLDEWHWKEHFSGQPENLRHLNYVVDKFGLRKHMQFNCKVEAMRFDEVRDLWQVKIGDGRELTCRFVVLAIGLLSAPTMPRLEGIDDFKGRSFHTYYWPHEPLDLAGKKVAVIGTGATAIQLIGEIADKVGDLTVFQRRPNWSAPLNNRAISEEEMADIRSRYDEIFAACACTPGGFLHGPDRRGFYEVTRKERVELWDKLTEKGLRTIERDYEFDIIVYATGFDAITGAYDLIDIRGIGGETLAEKWKHAPSTFLGMLVHGFPNLLMPTGPQSASASTNFPRGIENGVNWCMDLLQFMWDRGYIRADATREAQERWNAHVIKMYEIMLMRKAKSWFTGYNSNVAGHEEGTVRYFVYNGGTPKFFGIIKDVAAKGYREIEFRAGSPANVPAAAASAPA